MSLRAASLAALVAVILLRVVGPSDAWHQTQPKTLAYTTYLVSDDAPEPRSWSLPLATDGERATKPPLYNWLAAPGVRWIGTTSPVAHKLPSLVALVLTWVLLIAIGRRFQDDAPNLGCLSGLVLVCCYPMFKLGYLARPDMVLTCWLALGWWCSTRLLDPSESFPRWAWRLGFWCAFAGALLTKGPAALLLPLHLVAARSLLLSRDERRNTRVMSGWWWAAPLAVLPFALWIWCAFEADPAHVRDVLWRDEIWGRVTGTGPEGGGRGWRGIVYDLPLMPFYFLVRFAPWSLAVLATAICLIWRIGPAAVETPFVRTARSALLYIVLVIALFSLSSGKRADYIASAYPPGALLAAWWLTARAPRRLPLGARRGGRWIVAAALGAVSTLAIQARRDTAAPVDGFGRAMIDFARAARQQIDADPAPIRSVWTDLSPVRPFVGTSRLAEDAGKIRSRLASGESFWLLAGAKWSDDRAFADWLDGKGIEHGLVAVERSRAMPRGDGWPYQMTLYRARPQGVVQN